MNLSRSDCAYSANYCEENIWKLAARPEIDHAHSFVAIITNLSKQCALFSQRLATDPDGPVVWDYHVILLTKSDGAWLVLDLDTALPFPSDFRTYVTKTFVPCLLLPQEVQPMFRLVDAATYLREFSSDRSHMKNEDGEWMSAPPEWPEIVVEGGALTLSDAIDLKSRAPGEVLGLESLLARFT